MWTKPAALDGSASIDRPLDGGSRQQAVSLARAGQAGLQQRRLMKVDSRGRGTVGRTTPGEGNVVSGSAFSAVSIEPGDTEAGFDGGPALNNIVEGNKIGTDPAGGAAIPNDTFGSTGHSSAQHSRDR